MKKTPSDWHQFRETHKKAFEIVCDFIDESILQNNEVHLLKDLNNLYLAFLGAIVGSKYKDLNISSDKLSTKIQDHYGEKIKLEKGNTKKEICDSLRDLVPFVQFKKHEKHPWRSINFSKVAGFSLQLY